MSWGHVRARRRGAADATVFRITLEPSGKVLMVRSDQTILEAALEVGLPFPHQCKAALCTNCRCLLRSGRVNARQEMYPPLDSAEHPPGSILACQVEPRSDLLVHVEPRGNRPIS